MWCNETLGQNETDGNCKIIDVCHPPGKNSTCSIVDYDYELETDRLSALTLNILDILCFLGINIYYVITTKSFTYCKFHN